MTNNFSLICQIRDFGSVQICNSGTNYRSSGLARIAPWCLASRDKLLAKVPGLVTGWSEPPTLSAHTRNH